MELEERIDNLFLTLSEIEEKLKIKVKEKESFKLKVHEKKNSHLHILIETSLMKKIENQAKEQGISIAEFVRQKLKDNNQLNNIEDKLNKLLNKNLYQVKN